MKICLIGGGGFIGPFVERELSSIGDVKILEHPRSTLKGKNVIKADIINLEELKEKLVGFDVVVHLAAIYEKKTFCPTNEQMFDINVRGTFNILEACVANKINKMVFASSACAFGTAPDRLPVKEEHSEKPGGRGSGIYGASKFLGEGLCRSYTNMYEISTVCLRLVWVRDLEHDKDLQTSDHSLWFYVDVRDAAQAFRLACRKEGLTHEVFFISAEDTLSPTPNRELIRQYISWVPQDKIEPGFLSQDFASFYSIEKAKRVLGYSPEYSWKTRGKHGLFIKE